MLRWSPAIYFEGNQVIAESRELRWCSLLLSAPPHIHTLEFAFECTLQQKCAFINYIKECGVKYGMKCVVSTCWNSWVRIRWVNMAENRQMFNQLMREFIEPNGQHECLWKVKSRASENKNLQSEAYYKLAKLVQPIFLTTIRKVFCPRADLSLRTQEPRLSSVHCKLRNQSCSFARDKLVR